MRRTSRLLDALQGLEQQLAVVVLVGAPAVYLRTGEADVPVLPYTTDADIGIDPASLTDDPRLANAMSQAGFTRHLTNPGIWIHRARNVQVDLLFPPRSEGPVAELAGWVSMATMWRSRFTGWRPP